MDVVALALWDDLFRGVFFSSYPPVTIWMHQAGQEAAIRCLFFGNKRVMAHIGETQRQKQNE